MRVYLSALVGALSKFVVSLFPSSFFSLLGVELHTFSDLQEDDIESGKMIHYHKVKKTKWVVMAACTELNEL